MIIEDPAVRWLLQSDDPSIRYLTLTEVLGEPLDSKEVQAASKRILYGPKVRVLLSGQRRDGGFGVHPYQHWTGAHWRLVSLVELAIPRDNTSAVKATDQVLNWLTSDGHKRGIRTVNGLTRRCASQEGNALGVCSYLGMAEEPRVRQLAEWLVDWQWPDGGWNCDKRVEADHSSFLESLPPLWGLVEYRRATGDRDVRRAIDRASELFLKHRLFRSDHTGEIIKEEWLKLYCPSYKYYNILRALRILSLAGKSGDPRTRDAFDVLLSKRLADGRWQPEGYYWSPKGKKGIVTFVELADWGRGGPNEMLTLSALRVLKAAGRLN